MIPWIQIKIKDFGFLDDLLCLHHHIPRFGFRLSSIFKLVHINKKRVVTWERMEIMCYAKIRTAWVCTQSEQPLLQTLSICNSASLFTDNKDKFWFTKVKLPFEYILHVIFDHTYWFICIFACHAGKPEDQWSYKLSSDIWALLKHKKYKIWIKIALQT